MVLLTGVDQYLRIALALCALIGLFLIYTRLLGLVWRRVSRKKTSGAVGFLGLVLGMGLAVSTLLGAFSFYVYYGFGHQPDIYRHGDRASNMVAFTFDDGPSPDFTPAILDILRDNHVFATFFMVGDHAQRYPKVVQRVVAEGHEIGNHTQTHRNVPTLSTLGVHYELIGATAQIGEVTDGYPDYVRPPRGMYDARFRRLANLLGQKVVLWTVSSRDWRYGTTAEAVTKNVVSRAKGGDIILFHDSGALVRNEGGDRTATVKALPEIIARLNEKGLRIVPLKVLLFGEEPEESVPPVDVQE